MAERFLELLSNLLKIGKEQLFLKGELLRNKVPIKPVLGLTGLGVLLMAVRPLLTNNNSSEPKVDESTTEAKEKPEAEEEYSLQRTLYLMKEKEKELKRREESRQKS